jgi:hypothetical protein
MVGHAHRMHAMGVLSDDRLNHIKALALQERLRLGSTEEYIALRKSGDWDKIEEILNDERSGTAKERNDAGRMVAVDFSINETYEGRASPDVARKLIEQFRAPIKAESDDAAIGEYFLDLWSEDGGKVPDPPTALTPDWAKPLEQMNDESAHARDFRLRQEQKKGSDAWHRQSRRCRRR